MAGVLVLAIQSRYEAFKDTGIECQQPAHAAAVERPQVKASSV
jgi:hypothetical protein